MESRQRRLHRLIQKLGLPDRSPVRWDLLDRALTHPTASSEHYERLEFVGDAVVKLAAAEFLFATYPDSPEGELSAIRGVLVSDRTLAQIADRYGLERYLVIGGSAVGDAIGRETRLAAAMEAMLAALFLSVNNLSLVHPWLDDHLQEFAEIVRRDPTWKNAKGALQGLTQGRYQLLPDYRTQEIGTHGDPERFRSEVWVQGRCWGEGKGQSRKAAEQVAAQEAFLALREALELEDATDSDSP